jgi:L-amino acid N-acyltransferase YncA
LVLGKLDGSEPSLTNGRRMYISRGIGHLLRARFMPQALREYRMLFESTAEVSTYVDAGLRGRGIGRQLMQTIDAAAERLGFHTLIARISEGNAASIKLCEALGYVQTGVMKEVGLKFGKRLDVHILQRFFGNHPAV